MSEAAKAARAANKAKAKRLSDGDPKAKVDASSYTPPEMMNTEKKTGLRPVSRRAYKRGGKVHGEETPQNAGRKARKSNNMPTATAIANAKVNRNVKHANAEEFGQPHVGGYANGGYAKGGRSGKAGGGSMDDMDRDDMDRDSKPMVLPQKLKKTKSRDQIEYERGEMKKGRGKPIFKSGGKTGKMGGGAMGDPRAAAADRMAAANQQAGVPSGRMSFVERQGTPLPGSGMKKGGRTSKAGGGMMNGRNPSEGRSDSYSDLAEIKAGREGNRTLPIGEKVESFARKLNPLAAQLPAGRTRTPSGRDVRTKEDVDYGMKKGGRAGKASKIKNFEGSAKDEAQDKKLAAKRGMSMKAWEASEADEKHDKQQSMASLKKGGRAAKADGGKMDPRNAGKDGGGGPSGNDLMHAMMPLTMLMKKGGRVGKAGGGAMDGNYTGGTRPTGGRIAKAGGGLLSSLMSGSKASGSKGKNKKKGTNINIVINAGQKPTDPMADAAMPMLPPGKPPMLPPAMSAGAPAPAGGPPMPPPDMGGGAPGGGGLGALLGRKSGGRVGNRSYSSYKDMDAGAGSGLGRLEKTEIAKKTYRK